MIQCYENTYLDMIPEKKNPQSTELQRQTKKEMVIYVMFFLINNTVNTLCLQIPLSFVTNAQIQLSGSSALLYTRSEGGLLWGFEEVREGWIGTVILNFSNSKDITSLVILSSRFLPQLFSFEIQGSDFAIFIVRLFPVFCK